MTLVRVGVQIPINLTTPRIKLGYGEEIVHTFGTLRRKGLFGGRHYGELHVTNQRIAFVDAVMQGIAAAALSPYGVKPTIVFERRTVQVNKVALKKRFAIEITDGRKTERFLVEEAEADAAMALLG
jgi:hypothetical protein